MIKMEPKVGSQIVFILQHTIMWDNKKRVFSIPADGVIESINPDGSYHVSYDVDYNGTIGYKDIQLGEIHIYEWGGILVVNPKRDKSLLDGMG